MTDPQPRRARAAGRHRQLVRAPAGQALRRRARGLGDGLELRHPLRQRKTLDELLRIHPDERDRGPVSLQLFGHDPEVMRCAAATVAARRRRPDRPQHGLPGAQGLQDRRGRRAAPRSRHRRGRGPRRARGLRPAGHRQAARRRHARRSEGSRSPTGWSTRPASPPSASTRAPPPCTTRARPTTTSRPELVQTLPGAGDDLRRPARRRACPLGLRAHRRRRGHARPRLARQPVAVRAGPGPARGRARSGTRCSTSGRGSSTARRSTSAPSGPRATCASSTRGTSRSNGDFLAAITKRWALRAEAWIASSSVNVSGPGRHEED